MVITNCLHLGKVAAQGKGGVHLKVVITRHLLQALPVLYHFPTSSPSCIPGCITPIHLSGCGVTSSGSLARSTQLGWVLVPDINAPSEPLRSLYYFSVPLPGFLASSHFPFGMLLLPAAYVYDSSLGWEPPATAYTVSGGGCARSHSSP